MKAVLIFVVFYIFIINGCDLNENRLEITLKNNTDTVITLVSFSDIVKNNAPVSIEQQAQVSLFSDIFGDIDFTFLYKEKTYCTNTGYADDYRHYTIMFSENAQQNIECIFKVKSFGKEITRTLTLEEIIY
jgi:hypothetical protein